ncbi:T-lymphoma invasion and metastasis-inducing protein 1-like isoform X2 [Anguilla anguilla]|uniref:T-lymphoma invasion and metastasis-inducing protein 1-like isoform X2 n=1 Tax=Anguilla anguilla TaxID=7936 RepID=UPI0015AFFAE1|nr:T-lymphoma invasion and metastasis-inducing protein 1-like isoform X2 [Anguilla anguilla]
MGNVESQNGDHAFYADGQGHLSRKHTSRSLRAPRKQSRRARHASSGKPEHRNSETSTRSSSTPSIPQSLAENGLEPFDGTAVIWVDSVALNLRPGPFRDGAADADGTLMLALGPGEGGDGGPEGAGGFPEDAPYLQRMSDGPPRNGSGSFQKKRSKSADTWGEDSLEFSLSDLSQEHLTSTEEIADTADERDFADDDGDAHAATPDSGGPTLAPADRAGSLDRLCAQKSPAHKQPRNRYAKYGGREGGRVAGGDRDGAMSPTEDDGNGYGAYTLPCRRSHCLSEGLPSQQVAPCAGMQGRRAQTTHDVTEDSEYGDSGIDGVGAEPSRQSRRCKAMSASFSVYSAAGSSLFAGSDSGSSSGGVGGGACVYENFRQELEMSSYGGSDGGGGGGGGSSRAGEGLEEAGSAGSDERSTATASSACRSDALLDPAHGTVRKAGELAVKNFLVHKKGKKVEPAARRKWKRYWVSLKGCTLFFYETDGRSGIDQNSVPKHAVWAENSMVQAVPEHPKKDFVFCLSNSLGDAFLFQTSSQTELENWITALHSACAAAVARQHHRDDTVRLLRSEVKRLEKRMDMDEKMKKMGEMQLSAVTDAKKRKTILEQIFLWEQNLEQFHMDWFRFRCYLASLQGGELPNPKRLLAFASRPTKLAMGRLGIFSVSSFHALVAARTESGVRRRTQAMSRSSSKRKSRFSSLWGLDTASKKKTKGRPSINQVFADGEDPVRKVLDGTLEVSPNASLTEEGGSVKSIPHHNADSDIWVPDYLTPSWVCLPDDKPVLSIIQPGETALDVLEGICKAYNLDPRKHYLCLKFRTENQVQHYIPKLEEEVCDLLYKEIEVCAKATKLIHFDRDESCTIGYGFSVAVVEEDGVQQLHVSDVKSGGVACAKGLKAGDEILQLNGKAASVLNVSDMRAAFSQDSLCLGVSTVPEVDPQRLCQLPPRRSDGAEDLCTDIFSQNQEDILDDGTPLRLPSPGDSPDDEAEPGDDATDGAKILEQVSGFSRGLQEMSPSDSSSPVSPDSPGPPLATTPRQLSDADKLRKVISELVETERTYVKDLNCLIARYLTPLQKESFLTQDELDVLFGNLAEMVEFQVEFLKTLEDGTRLVPDLETLERVDQFKKVLFSLGGSFLYYADRFKIYSAFCASHTKVPKVLVKAKTDPDFKAFLDVRNPRRQHSYALESYLIKPIQRVLKYPLLLRELHSLTNPDSEEHYHLNVAMNAMNKVASHINEMQKIHEEYGGVFDQLIAEQTGDKKEVADLSMGDLLLHTSVAWINPPSSLAKGKRDPELATFVFKTAVVFVYKDCSKHKKKIGGSHRASVVEERDPFRFRHMIPTNALQVRALGNSEGTAMCELVHVRSESEGRPERTFHLCCSSPESKKDFLRAVHSILRDKQRRQLLKTESLPPNQQYVPFGGKRLCALKGARPNMNRAATTPPSRTLGRKTLVRNRFTIDTDIVFHGSPARDTPPRLATPPPRSPPPPRQHAAAPGGDTDRWVEEQFDLGRYDDQDDVKETDILSDDDEYCESLRGPSAEPGLEAPVGALSLEAGREDEGGGAQGHGHGHALKLSHLRKQCAVEGAVVADGEVVWVRRDDFVVSRGEDVF